jgi:hypothetical protein
VGAQIGALVEPEFVVETEDETARIDRGAHPVQLTARLVGGDQMLPAVLDPFDRPFEAERRGAGEDVLGIKLAADAEAAADMALVRVNAFLRQAEHPGQRLPVVVRHLGGTVEPQDTARGIRHRDRAAGFERHAGVASDREFELDHRMRLGEGGSYVTVTPAQDRGFAALPGRQFRRLVEETESGVQRLDLRRDEIGGILGGIGVGGKNRRDRLADIADTAARQYRLAVRFEPRHRGQAEIDRRDVGDVGSGPDRDHPAMPRRLVAIDREEPCERRGRAHDAHEKRLGRRDVGREPAVPGQ